MSIYGLIIGICLAASAWYFSKHNQIIPKSKEDLFTIGTIISAIFGARAYHVIEQWTYYSQDPIQILNTRAGGLAIYGGLIGGLLFICFFSILNHVSCILILDLITPILPLAQATGRIGNFINHENPLWWPEAIADFILFLIIQKLKTKTTPTGIYLIGYGLIRFITEFFRLDTWTIGNFHIAHPISIVFIICGIYLINNNYKTKPNSKKSL